MFPAFDKPSDYAIGAHHFAKTRTDPALKDTRPKNLAGGPPWDISDENDDIDFPTARFQSVVDFVWKPTLPIDFPMVGFESIAWTRL